MLPAVFAALATVPEPTTVPSTSPTTDPVVTTVPPTFVDSGDGGGSTVSSSIAEVIRAVLDNLGNNGYQTGVAILVMSVSILMMNNLKVQ